MPVKNAAEFLDECFQSIINQTYPDWELIAVDDHSTDDTNKILTSYSSQYTKIKPVINQGHGIIHALRTAYSLSSGDTITRMDADDIMPINKLEKLFDKLVSVGPGHLVVGLVRYFPEDVINEGYRKYEAWLNELTLKEINFVEIYKECSIPSPNWLVHREDLDKCGAFNSEIYPEDYDLAFRFKAAGLQLKGVNEVTHLWRDHPARSSRNDPNYSDNRFTHLKVKYFSSLDYEPTNKLFLWGAGNKGKAIAKELIDLRLDFEWVCNNPKKIGHDIYGKKISGTESLSNGDISQVIIAVSTKNETVGISQYLSDNAQLKPFFFC